MFPLKWEKRRQEYLREREEWFNELMEAGRTMAGRRKFLKMAASAAAVAAVGAFAPHSFQLVERGRRRRAYARTGRVRRATFQLRIHL